MAARDVIDDINLESHRGFPPDQLICNCEMTFGALLSTMFSVMRAWWSTTGSVQ